MSKELIDRIDRLCELYSPSQTLITDATKEETVILTALQKITGYIEDLVENRIEERKNKGSNPAMESSIANPIYIAGRRELLELIEYIDDL